MSAETPAAAPPAEVAPVVEAPNAPVPTAEATTAPIPAVEPTPEIEAAPPAVPEPPTRAPTPLPAEAGEPASPLPPPLAGQAQPAPEAAVSSAATTVFFDTSIKSRLGQAFEALRFRKRAKLDKILAFAAKKRRIKNDDVEKLLKVSDSTAQRYLKQLVQEGRLTASRRGNDAWYEPR